MVLREVTGENKYLKIKRITIKYSITLLIVYITVVIILGSNIELVNNITSWFFLGVWLLPIEFWRMREFKYSLKMKKENKIGNTYFCFALFTSFVFIACFIGFISILAGITPIWLVLTINFVGLIILLPGLALTIIIK